MDLKKLELAKEKLNGLSMNSIYKNDKHVKNSLDYIINELLDSEYLREKFRTADYTTLSIGMVKNNLSDVYFLTHKWVDDQIELMKTEETKLDDKKVSLKKENKVFIIHGHDGEFLKDIKLLMLKQKIDYVILSEINDTSGTIFSRVQEEIDKCKSAIVIYTPADEMTSGYYQARPNVIFEHGYALAKLGSKNVVMINNQGDDKEMPLQSDIAGLLYVSTSNSRWENQLLGNLERMGFEVDYKNI